jgi:hypothetical protein
MKKVDLVGKIFGDLTVICFADKKGNKVRWLCKCKCGAEKPIYATHLTRGNSTSCTPGGGHGIGKKIPGYKSWSAMIARCTNLNHVAYDSYGGRGILICHRWLASFANFYEDMGPRPSGKTLDRINTNGNYEPSNCRWATPKEQQNNMRSNKLVVIDGIESTISLHSDRLKINYSTLYSRLKRIGAI